APNAAAVLRWAGPLPLLAKGVLRLWISPHDTFEKNLVIPGVAEVVLVLEAEPPAAVRQDVADPGDRRVLILHVLEVLLQEHRVAVKLVLDLGVVQVRICPAHRRLDVLMEVVEGAILHLDTSPDRGMAFEERDLELVHGVVRTHPALLGPFRW